MLIQTGTSSASIELKEHHLTQNPIAFGSCCSSATNYDHQQCEEGEVQQLLIIGSASLHEEDDGYDDCSDEDDLVKVVDLNISVFSSLDKGMRWDDA